MNNRKDIFSIQLQINEKLNDEEILRGDLSIAYFI